MIVKTWKDTTKCLVNQLKIQHLMKWKSLNTHSSSIEPNTWMMTTFTNFKYFKIWKNMEKLMMILQILVKRLIVWRRLKVALALLFMMILNMDFCIFKIDTHNTSITMISTTPIFQGTKHTSDNIQMGVEWFIKIFNQ
jgi:hypothetical protein